jgi:hypothetical protein
MIASLKSRSHCFQLRIKNYELRIKNYELRIENYELRIEISYRSGGIHSPAGQSKTGHGFLDRKTI